MKIITQGAIRLERLFSTGHFRAVRDNAVLYELSGVSGRGDVLALSLSCVSDRESVLKGEWCVFIDLKHTWLAMIAIRSEK